MDNPVDLQKAVLKRRTFAIISHPDAGKTTLTEKLLLYSGMLVAAGVVKGSKGRKAAASDWMAMEQERGISITSSAMQFTYKDTIINVLDTPGHEDFSEDTYRTLTAADCAIMVIDASKGVEKQTRKLFEVCRLRKIPALNNEHFFSKETIQWHGVHPYTPDWSHFSRFISYTLANELEQLEYYIAFNAYHEPLTIHLPYLNNGKCWHVVLDTKEENHQEFPSKIIKIDKFFIIIDAYSSVILKAE